jgi:serine/threonine protein kinase
VPIRRLRITRGAGRRVRRAGKSEGPGTGRELPQQFRALLPARDTGLQHGKASAIKVARHREESGDTGRTHAGAKREVAVLLLLHHPNIIRPRGYGYLPDGRVWCALEYVDGWTLGEWKERTHPTFREILRVFAKLAGAMAYMHSRTAFHRDLKLSNVMIRRSSGEPVILDLGARPTRTPRS